ncbi:hypothetical protein B0H12DRAFT_1217451 [Mycena haematopus]|nr:hypothetical protein B0H12DRAFT_1217451 [Mycena haematopus]
MEMSIFSRLSAKYAKKCGTYNNTIPSNVLNTLARRNTGMSAVHTYSGCQIKKRAREPPHFRSLEPRDKSSEWPQFAKSHDGVLKADRRTSLSAPSNDAASEKLNTVASASVTPLGQQRRRTSWRLRKLKCHNPPHTRDLSLGCESVVNAGDLQVSLSRLPSGQYDDGSLTFSPIQLGGLDVTLQVGLPLLSCQPCNNLMRVAVRWWDGFSLRLVYNLDHFESGDRGSANSAGISGYTALYYYNGSHHGLGLPARINSGNGDGK